MADWLSTLQIDAHEEGHEVAVKVARVEIKLIQPDARVRDRLRPNSARDADALRAVSQTIAAQFATVVATNKGWRGRS